jgi:hypothetical protein
MLMKKVFFKPTRYIWNFDERVEKQEKKFLKEFEANLAFYVKDIYEDFIEYVEKIVNRYQNKVSTIINGLRSEDDQNKLLEQLEIVHHGINFRNAKKVLQRWEKEINEKIRPTISYN